MKWLTHIKIQGDYQKTTSSVAEFLSVKGGFLKTTISNSRFVGDGNGAFEKDVWKDFPKEIYVNTSLVETIEEIKPK